LDTGPCPPPGPARQYHLILYALDELVDLPPGSTKPELVVAMVNHVLRHAELKDMYQRADSSPPGGLKIRLLLLGRSTRT
jgi:phosphatidylethanolamine-binding protein (PEBP) family uncharacterized protein